MSEREATAAGSEPQRALDEALGWLREVDGRLLHRPEDPAGPDAWVAIVKTPAATGKRAELILGFGGSPLKAVETAQASWHAIWRRSGSVH